MSKKTTPPSESAGKVEEGTANKTPMERFRGVTRQLLGVSRDKLRAEQRRHGKKRDKRKTPPK